MAEIANNETISHVNETFEKSVRQGTECRFPGVFTGHTDIEVDGNFVLHHTDKKMLIDNWAPGEPNNWGSQEHCVVYHAKAGMIFDAPCSFGLICPLCSMAGVNIFYITYLTKYN